RTHDSDWRRSRLLGGAGCPGPGHRPHGTRHPGFPGRPPRPGTGQPGRAGAGERPCRAVRHISVHADYEPDRPLHEQQRGGLRWAPLPPVVKMRDGEGQLARRKVEGPRCPPWGLLLPDFTRQFYTSAYTPIYTSISCPNSLFPLHFLNTPKGTRTPVLAVRGLCPRPLDDGGKLLPFL